MPSQPNQHLENFIAFMQEYSLFLEKMLVDEKDRFAALSSQQLPRIEHSIAVSQANAKQLENFELKRQQLQSLAGFDKMTFRELLQQLPLEQQGILEPLFVRFGNMIEEIRFSNDKTMAVARDNMMIVSPELMANTIQKHPNPYDKVLKEDHGNILKTKV